MAEPLEKKIAKKKEKKRAKKQQEVLNNVGEGKWRRLGSFAWWAGYRVDINGEAEVVPVRKNSSRASLMNASNNLKRYIKKKKALELEANRKAQKTKKPTR